VRPDIFGRAAAKRIGLAAEAQVVSESIEQRERSQVSALSHPITQKTTCVGDPDIAREPGAPFNFDWRPNDLRIGAIQHREHAVFFAENAEDGRHGIHAQRLEFAQEEQSENVIKISGGEDDSGNGRIAARAGMKRGSGLDLRSEVGRGSGKKPGDAVRAQGELGLGARFTRESVLNGVLASVITQSGAVLAAAIPLRKPAPGGRTEDAKMHRGGLEFRAYVRVDFAAENDFLKNRS
jgi:hypothetical protein